MLSLTRVRWRHRARRLYSVPVAFVFVALVLSWAMPALDRAVDADLRQYEEDVIGFVFDPATVAGTLSAIASGMIAFSGLVFTLLLLAVQFGTGQLSVGSMAQTVTFGGALSGSGTLIATGSTSLSGDSTTGQLLWLSQFAPGPSHSFQAPVVVMPIQNGSYFSGSSHFATSCADLTETGCSSEQPPNMTPTFSLSTPRSPLRTSCS